MTAVRLNRRCVAKGALWTFILALLFISREATAAPMDEAPWNHARNCEASRLYKILVVTCPPYNAKADGISDDRAALNAANADAGTAGTIYLPRGTYKVGSTLALTSNLRLDPGAVLSP